MKIRDLINNWMRKRELAAYERGMIEGLCLGKIEGMAEGEHVAEEKLRAMERIGYTAGVESVHKQYPILRINEARAHAGTLLTGARLQEYNETHEKSYVPPLEPFPDWLNSKPDEAHRPPPPQPPPPPPEDKDDTLSDRHLRAIVKLKHASKLPNHPTLTDEEIDLPQRNAW